MEFINLINTSFISGGVDVGQKILWHESKYNIERSYRQLLGVHTVPQDSSQRIDERSPSIRTRPIQHHHECFGLSGVWEIQIGSNFDLRICHVRYIIIMNWIFYTKTYIFINTKCMVLTWNPCINQCSMKNQRWLINERQTRHNCGLNCYKFYASLLINFKHFIVKFILLDFMKSYLYNIMQAWWIATGRLPANENVYICRQRAQNQY